MPDGTDPLLQQDVHQIGIDIFILFFPVVTDRFRLLFVFDEQTGAWCRARGIGTRNEAHGSVANWLDFYDLADCPETEMYGFFDRDVLISKFASSSAHVSGMARTSAEACTWLDDHFKDTPLDYKRFLDRLLLAGVDKVYYHGLCYSPTNAVWPGWCFYASSETNPRNPLWRDFGSLNAYVTRVQSVSCATAAAVSAISG